MFCTPEFFEPFDRFEHILLLQEQGEDVPDSEVGHAPDLPDAVDSESRRVVVSHESLPRSCLESDSGLFRTADSEIDWFVPAPPQPGFLHVPNPLRNGLDEH